MLDEEDIKIILYLANEYASESAALALEEEIGQSATALEWQIKERDNARQSLEQYLESITA